MLPLGAESKQKAPTVQVSAHAEADLQAFLDRDVSHKAAKQAHEPVPALAPQLRDSQHKAESAAPVWHSNTELTHAKPTSQCAAGPVPASPHAQATAAYDSQQHFVDVLRQLEARKAELQKAVSLPAAALPDAAASAPALHGHGASQLAQQGATGSVAAGKRAAGAALNPGPGQKRLRLV